MGCQPTWGHYGTTTWDADMAIAMSAGDKRRGGSSATTPKNPQTPKPTKKGAPVVKRP